jgi:hypothetical protein
MVPFSSLPLLSFPLPSIAMPMHVFYFYLFFIFSFYLLFFYFFCLRLANVLAIALDYCRICESTKTLLCDDCLTVM